MTKQKAILRVESYSVKDGTLLLSASDWGVRAAIKGIVDLCGKKHGGYIQCDLSPPRKRRTLGQNDKWWALCTEYGNHCGMSKDDVAMGVKYRAMEEGLWRGESMPFSRSGQKRPVSTTAADTAEMSVLIEVLYRIAAEDGYVFDE